VTTDRTATLDHTEAQRRSACGHDGSHRDTEAPRLQIHDGSHGDAEAQRIPLDGGSHRDAEAQRHLVTPDYTETQRGRGRLATPDYRDAENAEDDHAGTHRDVETQRTSGSAGLHRGAETQRADQRRRAFDAVDLREKLLNLAGGKPTRVGRQDAVIEARELAHLLRGSIRAQTSPADPEGQRSRPDRLRSRESWHWRRCGDCPCLRGGSPSRRIAEVMTERAVQHAFSHNAPHRKFLTRPKASVTVSIWAGVRGTACV
jgi:hypothetical protein